MLGATPLHGMFILHPPICTISVTNVNRSSTALDTIDVRRFLLSRNDGESGRGYFSTTILPNYINWKHIMNEHGRNICT